MADLLVNDVEPRAQYTAAAAQTVFEYPFAIFEDADLLVYLTPAGQTADDDADILVLATDYTVSDAGETAGGDVTLLSAASSGDIITIVRDVAVARTSDYQTAGDLLAETVNDDFDKFVMMVQQQEDKLDNRILQFLNTVNLTGISTVFPAPVADGLLKWNAAANALQAVALSTLDPSLVTVSAFVETLLDDATADDFWVTLNAALTSGIALGEDLTLSKSLTQKKGADLGDADITAGVLTLGDGNIFDVNSSEAVTSIATKGVGTLVALHIDQAQEYTHHATDLVCPGAANLDLKAGDRAMFYEYASSDWEVIGVIRAGQEKLYAGDVVQVVKTQDGAVATGTTVIPADDTIPQNTEGDEYMTRTITPKNSANILKIDVTMTMAHSTSVIQIMTAALFKNGVAGALASMWQNRGGYANGLCSITFTHYMVAGTTSEIDFKVRGGISVAGTTTFNGVAGGRYFGGVMASSIIITEIKA